MFLDVAPGASGDHGPAMKEEGSPSSPLYQPVRAEWDGCGGHTRNIVLASAVTLSSEPARDDNKEQFHNSEQIMERDSL